MALVPKQKASAHAARLAWQSIETNQFGTDEFLQFCREINSLNPCWQSNLGTGSIQDAANLVEYCNAPAGSASMPTMRAANGRLRCLTASITGAWATKWTVPGKSAILMRSNTARKAREAAKLMRLQDDYDSS